MKKTAPHYVAHYGGNVRGIVEPDAVSDEWYSLREYIRRNNRLSQEQLVKLLLTEDTMAELYPSMRLLASVLMVIPVSTADKGQDQTAQQDDH